MIKQTAFTFLMVAAICVNHVWVVSGQYNNNNNNGFQPVSEQSIDTVAQTEYEYYDEYEDSNLGTTVTITLPTTTTTTTTTTPKPKTTIRHLTTRRNGIRSSNVNKLKFGVNKPFYADSYTEASNENAFVQFKQHQQQQGKPKQSTPPQLRNAIVDVDRQALNGKDYAQEKSLTSIESNNGNANYVSRRYARFLFKQRSG